MSDLPVPDFISRGPVWMLIAFLFVVVFLRSHATYWLGRGMTAGVVHSRWSQKFTGPRITRGKDAIATWGWPIIPFAYLTIGFQTAVMAAAGLVQMRYWRFLLASLPGCAAWAVVYGVGGLAVFLGGVELALRSPWLLVAALCLAAVVVVGVGTWRRRSRRPMAVEAELATDGGTEAS